MVSAILSGCFALVTAVTAAQVEGTQAASAAAATLTPPTGRELVNPPKNPIGRLFPVPQTTTLPDLSVPSTGGVAPNAADFEVVCGLRVWRVDARQDPRMLLPRQTAVDAKIRKIAPTVCHAPLPEDPSKK